MPENEVIVKQTADVIQKVDMQTITEYLDSTGLTTQLQPNEKAMFVNMARDFGLNPFKREIYCTVYGEGKWRKCSIVTGYEVYLKRAERIGKLDGWNVSVAGSLQDGSLSATVTIYRKDWSHPFQHTAYYVECVNKNKEGQPNAIWAKMPIFMTRKVAIAQAFRLCFSDEFGGMPYTNDEIEVEPAPTVKLDITTEATADFVQQNEPVTQKTESGYNRLYNLVQNFGEQLKQSAQTPTPYQQACEVIGNPTEDSCANMYNRCVAWLGKKGVKVA